METKKSLVKIVDKQHQWEDAIKIGVDLLINSNIATKELADSIIKNTKELGPYYVLMPKVALAHTSPGSYNKKIGMSLVLFKEPVLFSSEERHQVNLLFTLSAIDGETHMEILSKFANLFADKLIFEKAINTKNEEELFEIFKEIL